MSKLDTVKKVMLYQKDKSGFVKEPTMAEMADLVVLVLSQVRVIEDAIKAGRLDGKTPVKDVDYISRETAVKMLTQAVNEALNNEEDKFISRVESKFNSKVYQSEKSRDEVVIGAIERINRKLSEVKDGVVTEEEIRRAANIALGMIKLPDFASLIKDSLDGETVRNALSLLTGDKRYQVQIADVDGLAEALAQVSQIRGSGGTIGKQQVYNFIRQAIADGTITSGGISDGDKGDITVSSSGTVWTIDNGVVTETKLSTSVNASLDLADTSFQKATIVSGSLTAANDTYYVNVSSATYTDPSPVEGKGFVVFVRNGTATVGGTGYGTAGTIVHRIYHSGAWANYVYQVSSTFLTSANISDTAYGVGWNGDTTTAPSKNAVYDEIELRAPKASPSFTGTVTLPTGLTGVLRADSGVVSTDSDVTDLVTAASDTTAGKVELATITETNTGTDTGRAVTPDGLAGSNLGIRYVQCTLNGTTALTTSEKCYFRIPAALTGMNLVSVTGTVGTGAAGASSSGTPTFTVKNVTDNNQMLSTSLTIDANEYTSATAATAAVIDTTKDDVVTDDLIEVAVTTAGTGVTYATVTLGFQLP